ncbi:MAG: replicative DNA helicase [Bacteroidales bacterium]|nr:replicative DNA helicase [Bacteroidales bacterium]MDZ4205377.1 replicative DNA helicase [Bacteroidales bacterium]
MNEVSNTLADRTRKRVAKPTAIQNIMEHGKLPPQALELEEAVLGAIMLEKDALTAVIDKLKPEIFYREIHQMIYRGIVELFRRSEPVDILTVTNELKSSGELEIVGGAYFIAQLTNRVSSAANVEYHAHIIIQKFIQRELIRISSEIIQDAFEDTTDVFDMLDKAEQNLFAVSESNLRRNVMDMPTLIKEAIDNIERAKNIEGHLSGVPSGFTKLDGFTAGWQKSDLIIIAARPGMGKTSFVLTMARNIAVDFKQPIAFFSLEMSAIQLVTRLIAAESMLPAEKLKKGTLESHEWQQLNTKIKDLEKAPIYIDDTPALTIFELRAKCRRLKAQYDIQMAIVDYLQLMSGSGDNKGNREQEISNISRSLKSLAKELNIPIIAISQLSRAVETRGGPKKPILSDLRDSGAIEQDADLVLFLYRPQYYNILQDSEGHSTQGLAELSIAKHRNGPQGEVKLRFIEQYALFLDMQDTAYFPEQSHSLNPDYSSGPNVVTFPSKLNDMDDSYDSTNEPDY